MTDNIKIFESNEFGKVTTLTDNNNVTWFLGKEIAAILGYSDLNKAIAMHVDNEDKMMLKKASFGVNDNLSSTLWSNSMDLRPKTFINISGLYSLILSSKLPKAKAFKHWVTSEVLPSIQETGSYSINRPSYLIEDPIEQAKAWIKEEEERRRLASENSIMKPKAGYFGQIVDRKLNTNFRDTAKELGVKQNEFIKFLLDNGYVYRDVHNKLKPTADSMNDGLMELKEWSNNKTAGNQTLVTPKGKETFRLLIGSAKNI